MGHAWTEKEIEFIKEKYPYHANQEIVEMIAEKFGFKTTKAQLKNLKHKHKIKDKKIPNSGCFKKGAPSHNKGKTMSDETKKKVSKTWFKKGNIPHNYKPLGSMAISKDGYKLIKIANPNKWILYHRYLWEKAHGEKVKSDEVVIFADRDKSNFSIDNLIKIKRSNLLYLNRKDLIFEDKELTGVAVNISRLNEQIAKQRKGKRNGCMV